MNQFGPARFLMGGSCFGGGQSGPPTLRNLTLSPVTMVEGTPAAININRATAGSTITVQSGALPTGLTLNSAARTITGTPTVVDDFTFTLREALAGATNTPHDTAGLSLAVTEAPPTLIDLSLSPDSASQGEATVIDVIGATAGSTITVQSGALPDGLTLDSAAREIAGTPTTIEAPTFTLREALAGATNTPHDTAGLSIDAVAAIVPAVIYSVADQEFQFTNSASFPGATLQWFDASDDSPISGATTAPLAYADAPPGEYVYLVLNDDPALTSNLAIAPAPVSGYLLDPADPAYAADDYYLCASDQYGPITPGVTGWAYTGNNFGTPPAQMSRWVGIRDSYISQLVTQGGGLGFIKYPTGLDVYNAVFTVPPIAVGIFRVEYIAAGYGASDFFQYMIIARASYDLGSLSITCNGFNGDAGIFDTGTTVDWAANVGKQVSIRVDFGAETIVASLDGTLLAGTGTGTFTGLDNTGGQAQNIGIRPSGGIVLAGTPIAGPIGFSALGAGLFTKISSTFTTGSMGVDPFCAFDYIYSGTVANIRWAVLNADGVPLLGDWTTVATNGDGTGSIEFDTFPIEGLTGGQVAIEAIGDPTTISLLPLGTVPYYPLPVATEWGIQQTNVATYSPEAFCAADMGLMATWYSVDGSNATTLLPLTETYFNADGFPTGALPVGGLSFVAVFWDQCVPGYGQDGSWQATFPTTGFSAASWRLVEECTASTVNLGAGTAQITGVTTGSNPRAQLQLTPTVPGAPIAGGLRVGFSKVGETNTIGFSTAVLGDYRAGHWWRSMMWGQATAPYAEIGDGTGLRQVPWATGTQEGAAVVQTGAAGIHKSLPINATDDWTTQWATDLKAQVPSGTVDVVTELGNEWIFNGQTFPEQYDYAFGAAVNGGFVTDVPAGTYPNYRDNGVDSATGETEVTIATGEEFCCASEYSDKVVRNISGAPILPGYFVPNEDTGYDDGTTLILADSMQTGPAMMQWGMATAIQQGEIVRTVLAGHCDVRIGNGSFLHADLNFLISNLLAGGTGTEYARGLTYNMPSGYADMSMDWTGTDPPPPDWLLDYADQSAFNAGLLAFSTTQLAATVATLKTYRNTVYSGLRSAGIPVAQCPDAWCYEGNYHIFVYHIPVDDQIGVKAAFESFAATYGYDWQTDYCEAIQGIGLAGNIVFASHERAFGATWSMFGLEPYVNAVNDPAASTLVTRFQGLTDFEISIE